MVVKNDEKSLIGVLYWSSEKKTIFDNPNLKLRLGCLMV
jgi:hypothetical protein